MKHVTYGDKTLFMGDDAADALTAYAAALADHQRADTVTLNAIGPDGHSVEATFVLDQGSTLMTETADDNFVTPDNGEALRYMKERTAALTDPPEIVGMSQSEADALDTDLDTSFER
jgi:hypothetical protein